MLLPKLLLPTCLQTSSTPTLLKGTQDTQIPYGVKKVPKRKWINDPDSTQHLFMNEWIFGF